MVEKKGANKRLDKKAKYETILKSAVKVFAKNGFHNSTISEIAKAAGVADGTIYLYFRNKDDILIRLFEDRMDAAIGEFKKTLGNVDDPVIRLEIFISRYIEYMEKRRALAEVISVELRQSHKFMKEYVPVKFAEFLNLLSEIVKDGIKKGIFHSDIKPEIVKRAIFGALDEMVLYWVLTPKPKYTPVEIADNLKTMVIEGLRTR